ncbi:MAG: MFS transporter [Bacteroidales bacterium]|nr:MFS transporter [Tenuifilaceae bacterium]
MKRFLNPHSYFRRVGFAFRALKIYNFRLFFMGQTVSLMGAWIQNIALGWLVYRITGSAVWLGVIGFLGQIPALFLTPFAGVFADRLNRRKVLIVTQSIPMVLAFTTGTLILTNVIEVWHIAVIATLSGIVIAFDNPFRHAFLLEMIGDKDLLQNSIALNSTLFNSARFIGPMIGGFLIAWVGEAMCFMINGVSALGVVSSLLIMRVVPTNLNRAHGSVTSDLVEGAKYAFNSQPIRILLLLVVTMGFFGLPFQVFMPIFAKDILGGGAQLLGFLTGAFGAGALTGAIYLASLQGVRKLPKLIFVTSLVFALGLFSLSLSTSIALSLVMLYITGFGMIVQFASSNTLIQTIVDDTKRGRVMALYGMSFLGITPLGSLLLGTISESVGVQLTLMVASLICLTAGVIFYPKVKVLVESIG